MKYHYSSELRLPYYDYGANGVYFITICSWYRKHFFGEVQDGKMQLSPLGKIAEQYWIEIPKHFSYAYLDEFIVMPNHLHGIIVIDKGDQFRGAGRSASRCRGQLTANRHGEFSVSTPGFSTGCTGKFKMQPDPESISIIIRSFKGAVTNWSRQNGNQKDVWQSRFFDHIVRNEQSINNIRQYIKDNPRKWEENRNNPYQLWM